MIKTVSVNTYGATSDALELTTTYRVSNSTDDYTAVVQGAKKTITTFLGNEGEEKAQKTFNFNFAGTKIKTVSVNTYGATSDALELTTTFRVSNDTADRNAVIQGAKKSVTTFSGNEGEEKAQRSFNFNFAGDKIKTISVNSYNAQDALSLTTTFRASNETADYLLAQE